MAQTRAEAAGLVVRLQQAAVTQGLLYGLVAAVAGLSFVTAFIVWVAVAAPTAWRGTALAVVALALLAVAAYCAITARSRFRRDAGLIADFARGLRLDLAMINLALRSPETEDAGKLAARERAKTGVREAAVEKAAAPSTAEGGAPAAPDGPAMEAAAAALRAASPRGDVQQPGAPPTAGAGGYATSGGSFASTSMTDSAAAGEAAADLEAGKHGHGRT